MKRIYLMLFAAFAMGAVNTSCSEEDPFATISPEDNPMILDPLFPDRVNGELPIISQISHGANFKMDLTVTPSDYTEVTWEIDGEQVCTGNSIEIALEAGTYHLKVVATTTAGKSTYREANVVVTPLEGEPWSEEQGIERIVVAGSSARLYGINLKDVTGVAIGETTATVISYSTTEDGDCLEYVIPDGLADGQYRISLLGTDGARYGANMIRVVSSPVITAGFNHATSNAEWVMTGLNLDKITSFELNRQAVSDFVSKSDSEIVLVCPDMADGEYTLKGLSDGNEVLFYNNGELVNEVSFAVISGVILWEGHHYVSWDLADGDPNKTFNLIPADQFSALIPGSKLCISYSIAPEATYYQIRTTTGYWNDLPGTAVTDVTEDGVVEVILTQEVLSKIQSEDGFLCVGHGFYVDKVSVE